MPAETEEVSLFGLWASPGPNRRDDTSERGLLGTLRRAKRITLTITQWLADVRGSRLSQP